MICDKSRGSDRISTSKVSFDSLSLELFVLKILSNFVNPQKSYARKTNFRIILTGTVSIYLSLSPDKRKETVVVGENRVRESGK